MIIANLKRLSFTAFKPIFVTPAPHSAPAPRRPSAPRSTPAHTFSGNTTELEKAANVASSRKSIKSTSKDSLPAVQHTADEEQVSVLLQYSQLRIQQVFILLPQ